LISEAEVSGRSFDRVGVVLDEAGRANEEDEAAEVATWR
jgi:hypothetical protein